MAGLAPGLIAVEEVAARATRSSNCPEDCEDDREAVVRFALRTRPVAIPAHSEPTAVGASDGNSFRRYKYGVLIDHRMVGFTAAHTSTLKPFHALSRLFFFSSSSNISTNAFTRLAVPSIL